MTVQKRSDSALKPMVDPVRVPKAGELVARELRRRIVVGELVEGDSLPPESELMTQFEVSRPTLREAFRVLEAERLITVRRGVQGGARVQAPRIEVAAHYTGLILQVRNVTLADVYQARLIIEPPLAGLLAVRQNRHYVRLLREAIDEEADAIGVNPRGVAAAAARIHQLIAEGAGNATMAVLTLLLQDIVHRHMTAQVASKDGRPEQERDNRRGLLAHRKLMTFVEERDGDGAEAFWRTHMEKVGEYLLKEYGSMTVVDLLQR